MALQNKGRQEAAGIVLTPLSGGGGECQDAGGLPEAGYLHRKHERIMLLSLIIMLHAQCYSLFPAINRYYSVNRP